MLILINSYKQIFRKLFFKIVSGIVLLFIAILIFSWILNGFPSFSKDRIITRPKTYLFNNKNELRSLISSLDKVKAEYTDSRILINVYVKQFEVSFMEEIDTDRGSVFNFTKPKTSLPFGLRSKCMEFEYYFYTDR